MKHVLILLLSSLTATAQFGISPALLDATKMTSIMRSGCLSYWPLNSITPADLINALNGSGVSLVSGDVGTGHASDQSAITFSGSKLLNTKDWIGRETGTWTPTGVCLDTTDGTYWIADFDNGSIVHVSLATNNFALDTIATITPFAAGDGIQGVVRDTWDDTLWVTGYTSKKVLHCYKNGTTIANGWTLAYNLNHCAYEPGRSSLWVVENIAAGSTQKVHRFDTNGVEQEVISTTLPSGQSFDGVYYDAGNDCLWLTADDSVLQQQAEIYQVNKTTGATNFMLKAMHSIEGITMNTSTSLVYVADALFHTGVYSGNRLLTLATNGTVLDNPITNAFSLSLWAKPSVTSQSNVGLFAKEDGAGTAEIIVLLISNAVFTRVNTGTGLWTCSGGSPAITDTSHWYHIGVTWDGATIRNYVDGALSVTNVGNGAILPVIENPQVGHRRSSSTFSGSISDARFFSRCLSAAEVKTLSVR